MALTYQISEDSAYLGGEEFFNGDVEKIYVANLITSEIFTFDGSAAVIWSVITDVQTLDSIVAEVAAIFDENIETVREGTKTFLEDLVQKGLVKRK